MDLAIRQALEKYSADRRGSTRYPIAVAAEYRILSGKARTGCRVLQISTTGLLLESETTLNPGTELEIILPWPAYHGKAGGSEIQLIGRVVRKTGNLSGIRIERSVFAIAKAE